VDAHPLKIRMVLSEMFGQNAYIAQLDGRNDCVVVDPGFDPEPSSRRSRRMV